MNIDHHIQHEIIRILLKSEKPLTYTSLKLPEIGNSLFSYHLNKLIDRNLIYKSEQGYEITVDGARWLHDSGSNNGLPRPKRTVIAVVVQNDRGEYLIGQRSGQFKTQINDYLLPSLYYEDDGDIDDQITKIIDVFVPTSNLINREEYGFSQIKVLYEDKTMWLLFSITKCLTSWYEPSPDLKYSTYGWMTLAQLKSIHHPSIGILLGIIDYTLDDENVHSTPLFVGS